jgi:zinc/manganese transport system permease protein
MDEALSFLLPAAVAMLMLVAVHLVFGLQVLRRGVIFADLALAQVAALGATVAFALGHAPQGTATFGWSAGCAFAAALFLSLLRFWPARIPREAVIGIIYVLAAAAALLIVEKAPQGAEHIRQMLTGSILTVGWEQIARTAPLYAVLGGLQIALSRVRVSEAAGWPGWLSDLVFYATFGIVVTSSVALAGVLLVFALLIIPAAIGVLYGNRLPAQLGIGWAVGAVASLLGLIASYAWDLSPGAAIVCSLGLTLALAALAKWLAAHGRRGAFGRAARGLRLTASVTLAISAAWLIAAPRSDQPLLDTLEYSWPSVRTAYLTAQEAETFADAEQFAARYRDEAEKLNALELRSRWQGSGLSDDEVRKLSSFVQSYGEMRRGEEFVMHEVRARARERVRWYLAGLAFLGGILLAGLPNRVSRLRKTRAGPDSAHSSQHTHPETLQPETPSSAQSLATVSLRDASSPSSRATLALSAASSPTVISAPDPAGKDAVA